MWLLTIQGTVFELYFYIKSQELGDVLLQAWNYLFQLGHAAVAKDLFVILGLQLIFLSSRLWGPDYRVIDLRLIIFPILFLFSFAPLYAV
jgi:hypothetical protein